jgi:predicted nucleotidyltransferase
MSIGSPLEPVSDEFIAGIVRRQLEENELEDRLVALRLLEAKKEAARLAALIAALSGTKRVFLFGSAATGRRFRLDSDIDLAIEGCDLFAAMGIAEESSFSVDVVDLATAHTMIRASVEEEGVLLYEAKT